MGQQQLDLLVLRRLTIAHRRRRCARTLPRTRHLRSPRHHRRPPRLHLRGARCAPRARRCPGELKEGPRCPSGVWNAPGSTSSRRRFRRRRTEASTGSFQGRAASPRSGGVGLGPRVDSLRAPSLRAPLRKLRIRSMEALVGSLIASGSKREHLSHVRCLSRLVRSRH
eukprot:scaffold43559_cov92-Phaeocystis_antarctica.AAC.1